jgi:hypothetical protein
MNSFGMTSEEIDKLDKEIELAIDMMPLTDKERDNIIDRIGQSMREDIY